MTAETGGTARAEPAGRKGLTAPPHWAGLRVNQPIGARCDEVMRKPRGVGGAGGDLQPSRSVFSHLPLTFDLDTLPEPQPYTRRTPHAGAEVLGSPESSKVCGRNPETSCLLWASVSLFARWERIITKGQTSSGFIGSHDSLGLLPALAYT